MNRRERKRRERTRNGTSKKTKCKAWLCEFSNSVLLRQQEAGSFCAPVGNMKMACCAIRHNDKQHSNTTRRSKPKTCAHNAARRAVYATGVAILPPQLCCPAGATRSKAPACTTTSIYTIIYFEVYFLR